MLYCDSSIAFWPSRDGQSINVQSIWPKYGAEYGAAERYESFSLVEKELTIFPSKVVEGDRITLKGAISAFNGLQSERSWLYMAVNNKLYRIEYKVEFVPSQSEYQFKFIEKGQLIKEDFINVTHLFALPKGSEAQFGGEPFNLIVADSDNKTLYFIDDKRQEGKELDTAGAIESMETDIRGVVMSDTGLFVALRDTLQFYECKSETGNNISGVAEVISIKDLAAAVSPNLSEKPSSYFEPMEVDTERACSTPIPEMKEIISLTQSCSSGHIIVTTNAGLLVRNRAGYWSHVVPCTNNGSGGKEKHYDMEVAYVDQWVGHDVDKKVFAFRKPSLASASQEVIRIKLPVLDKSCYAWPPFDFNPQSPLAACGYRVSNSASPNAHSPVYDGVGRKRSCDHLGSPVPRRQSPYTAAGGTPKSDSGLPGMREIHMNEVSRRLGNLIDQSPLVQEREDLEEGIPFERKGSVKGTK